LVGTRARGHGRRAAVGRYRRLSSSSIGTGGAGNLRADERQHIARLLISCPDRHGIIAAVSRFLFDSDANILSSDQHSTDVEGGTFFMRMEFRLEALQDRREELERAFAEKVATPFGMAWRFAYASERKRAALLASRDDHCLLDLLWRWRRGELDADAVAVVSNHPDRAADVQGFRVPYHHIPVSPGGKAEAESQMLELLAGTISSCSPATCRFSSRNFWSASPCR